jgi:S1-C subfamily serine protease
MDPGQGYPCRWKAGPFKLSTIGLLPAAIALTVLSACAPVSPGGATNFSRNGADYASPAAALDARHAEAETSLATLATEPDPVLGKLRIVIPDRDRLRPYAMSRLSEQGSSTPAQLSYLTDDGELVMQIDAEALTRTRAFQYTKTVQQNDTLDPDTGDADFVLWFQISAQPGPTGDVWTGRWLVRRAGDPATQPASFDPGTRPLSPAAYASFVKSVRLAALGLGGKTAGGAHALAAAVAAGTSGSGLIVDTHGHVVTNNHVVPACSSIRAFDGARDIEVTMIARDTINDLALLKLSTPTPRAVAFRDSTTLRAGEGVIVTGYPLPAMLGSDMSITSGSVTSLRGLGDDSRMVQISAPVQPGNSGGPLLDGAGNVVGLVSRTLSPLAVAAAQGGTLPQNVNFAIKANVVEAFLAANHVAYGKKVATRELPTPDIGDKARKFTVRIDCR